MENPRHNFDYDEKFDCTIFVVINISFQGRAEELFRLYKKDLRNHKNYKNYSDQS